MTPNELERWVERADLDPEVHVLLLAGNGTGFCGGYDLVESAEAQAENERAPRGHVRRRVVLNWRCCAAQR